MSIIDFPKNRYSSKSELIFHLIELAQAKGCDITLGSNNPQMRYDQIRERFPNVVMVLSANEVVIKGKKNGR